MKTNGWTGRWAERHYEVKSLFAILWMHLKMHHGSTGHFLCRCSRWALACIIHNNAGALIYWSNNTGQVLSANLLYKMQPIQQPTNTHYHNSHSFSLALKLFSSQWICKLSKNMSWSHVISWSAITWCYAICVVCYECK